MPIVAMTANAMKADRDRCLQAGMNDFVTKPIRPDELWRVLLERVQHRPGLGVAGAVGAAPALQVDAGAAPEDQVLLEELGRVTGLDVPSGLRSTLGNVQFYAGMLRKFMAGQADTIARISQCLEAGDAASAERYAHTLKGVSASLGANRLAHIADALERCLRTGAQPQARNAALAHTQELLEALLAELANLPHLVAEQVAARPLNEAEQADACATLQTVVELLAQDDPSAADLWEAHAVALKTLVQHAEAIDVAIRSFEFERALQLLRSAGEGTGAEPEAAAAGSAPQA
jgi:two-component system sensor histidine kinase/response regulator